MPNYGDVAVRLSADWSRNQYDNQEQVLMIVGHEGGEADAYLTDDPDGEHQFYWVDPDNKFQVTGLQMRHYEFVNKDKWTKRLDYLWEWNAKGHVAFAGQELMARPKRYWIEDEKKRDGQNEKARRDANAEAQRAPGGLRATEVSDNTVQRRKRA